MASRIKVLAPEVVAKIAAGEVIERPASVVKELVENSLDAGSSTIKVEIEEGGKKRIMVMDDGEGMNCEDALLALQRHATSKIQGEEDLDTIRTLGFRGEALPSIAVVSRLRLTTRTWDDISGTQIIVHGGEHQEIVETGSPPGTRVEIEDLFYNLPARRKSLRGVQSELAHIIEVVTRMALINPSVSFILTHNKRVLFHLSPTQEEQSRIRAILGKEIVSHLVRVEGTGGGDEIRGWMSLPPYVRGSSKGIYIYVNRRYIRDKMISHAISEAYHRLIPTKMYPVVILSLSIPLTELDVNVHPTKVEVHFRNGEELHRLVTSTLRRAMDKPAEARAHQILEVQEDRPPYPAPSGISAGATVPLPQWRVVGQIKGTYLVVEGEEGVMIIDQHAAHERILYDTLKTSFHGVKLSQQRFLIPYTIDLNQELMQVIMGYRAELARLGLELEEFGDRTLIVTSIPSFLQREDLRVLLETLGGELMERGKSDTLDHSVDTICALLACRGAIKANRRLHDDEVQSVIRGLEDIAGSATCPHGRPTFVRWSWQEVEKWFRRN